MLRQINMYFSLFWLSHYIIHHLSVPAFVSRSRSVVFNSLVSHEIFKAVFLYRQGQWVQSTMPGGEACPCDVELACPQTLRLSSPYMYLLNSHHYIANNVE